MKLILRLYARYLRLRAHLVAMKIEALKQECGMMSVGVVAAANCSELRKGTPLGHDARQMFVRLARTYQTMVERIKRLRVRYCQLSIRAAKFEVQK